MASKVKNKRRKTTAVGIEKKSSGIFLAAANARTFAAVTIGVFVILFSVLSITSFLQKSPTADEPIHLFSGYSYLKWGDFRANPEHPPLAKMWAALPLMFLIPPKYQPPAPYWDLIPTEGTLALHTVNAAAQTLFVDNDAETLFFYAKLMMVFLALVLGFFIFKWCRELFGLVGAIAALLLYAFDPNILAHGSMVHTDIPFATIFFIGTYFFRRALYRLNFSNLICASVFFGLAAVTKWTYMVMFLTWAVFALVRILSAGPIEVALGRSSEIEGRWKKCGVLFGLLSCALITAYVFIWAAYGFSYHAVPGGTMHLPMDQQLPQSALARSLILFLTRTHFFPEAWIYGQLDILGGLGRDTYFLGENRIGAGFWLYFPVVFLVKTPLPTLLILLATFSFWLYERNKRPTGVFLLIPVILYFSLAVGSGLNIGLRHVLPIYPFLFVLAGGTAVKLWQSKNRVLRGMLVAIGGWLMATALLVFPNYLSFFNELIGGSRNGHKVVIDSNLDWGQDIKGLGRWMKIQGVPKIQFLYFGAFSAAIPRYYGIDAFFLPGSWVDINDLVQDNRTLPNDLAISVNHLYGYYWRTGDEEFVKPFRELKPFTRIGESIWMYKMDQAIEQYRQLVDANPKSAERQYHLANLLSHGGMVDEALRHYRQAVELAPSFAAAHNNLAMALVKANLVEEAIVHWRKVLELPPLKNRFETLLRLGMTLARYRRFSEAKNYLEEITKIRPSFAPAYYNLGILSAAEGRMELAVDYFRRTLQIDPQYTEAQVGLARALAEQGKPNEAAEQLREAIRKLKDARRPARANQAAPDAQ